MPPKKASSSSTATGSEKRKVVRKTIDFKKELIAKYEDGVRVSELAREYDMAKSTISTILKNKDTIKATDVAKGSFLVSKQRPQIIEEVEKLLLIFINEKQLAGDSKDIICEKAREIYSHLIKESPGANAETFDFKASRGWFDKFKRRSGICHVARHGEASSADRKAAEEFKVEFCTYVNAEGYVPQQVFSCDETGLFWKKMPRRTYITREEKTLPGHKPMKDRLTLLLCGNASGDFKVKPLLVYHSENPRAFKANNVMRSKLAVMWRSNPKAWLSRQYFTDWIVEVFAPSVKKYLQEENLPLKCLLVMDNAPAHHPGLEDDLGAEFDFIKIKFLPTNTTSLTQPMDQQVISNFKKLYTKFLFKMCFEVTSDTELTLRDFWKNHFNILRCINLVDQAWNEVSYRTMNSAWRKLWPDCVAERDFEGFQAAEAANTSAGVAEDIDDKIIENIVTLGQSMDLEIDNEDVEELLEEHCAELTTEELVHLQNEQKKILVEEMASGEEDERKDAPASLIKEMCGKWGDLRSFVEKYYPDKGEANRTLNLFNDTVMGHFRKVLKRRQKQITLDRFLIKDNKRKENPEVELPTPKRVERQRTPEGQLPQLFIERDSPSKQ